MVSVTGFTAMPLAMPGTAIEPSIAWLAPSITVRTGIARPLTLVNPSTYTRSVAGFTATLRTTEGSVSRVTVEPPRPVARAAVPGSIASTAVAVNDTARAIRFIAHSDAI